jgi:hypothetical protein
MHGRLIGNLKALADHSVRFVVVGGIGAVLHGCPLSTFDLDVVHERSAGNIARLQKALESLDAVYRMQPGKRLRPSAEALAGPGHHLLLTRNGPMDVLGEIGLGHDYEELAASSEEIVVDESLKLLVLNLEWIIRTKEEAGAPKDLAALDLLRATLNERNKPASTEPDAE